MKKKQTIGFILGIALAVIVWFLPLKDISVSGQRCLAFSLLAVVWWATAVMHPGYTAITMLLGYVLSGVAPAGVVFGLWTKPLVYMIVGGYLIASAVKSSGLGKRLAYLYALKYITDYKSIIIGAYLLGFLLSFLIPHPWPRSFMIIAVLAMLTRSANMPKEDSANIGLAVFASSCATSTVLLTGDATLNLAAVELGGLEPEYLTWLKWMVVPGIAASVLMLILQFMIYKPKAQFSLNKEEVRQELAALGPWTPVEKRCLFWILVAVVVWATDSIHHINASWVALGCAIVLALPKIGGVLNPGSWNDVPIATLFFLTAALGIGTVGAYMAQGDMGMTADGLAQGMSMNKWIASVVLPSNVGGDSILRNPFVFAAFTSLIAIIVHMCLGSAMAVLGIVVPTMVGFGATLGVPALAVSLLVYIAVATHFILPFQHMNILVGLGEKQGGYNEKDVIRLGVPLTVVVFIVNVLVAVPVWKITGLM